MKLKDFFDSRMRSEYSHSSNENAYADFLSLLRNVKILNGQCTKKQKACSDLVTSGFLTKSRCEVCSGKIDEGERLDVFKRKILDKIHEKKLYTYSDAVKKSRLSPNCFETALKDSLVWASSQKRLSKNESYICFGLFTENAIKKIVDSANKLKNVDNVFFIQWVGPFKSVESCAEWERKNSISDFEYTFYYGMGKPPHKSLPCFYIGKSEQKNVTCRVASEDDPISKDFRPNAKIELWIGRFSQRGYRSYIKDEKIHNHDLVEIAEWALVHGFLVKNKNLEDRLINDKKKSKPKDYCCVINQWHDKSGMRHRRRSKMAAYMPGLILHYDEEDDVRIEDF